MKEEEEEEEEEDRYSELEDFLAGLGLQKYLQVRWRRGDLDSLTSSSPPPPHLSPSFPYSLPSHPFTPSPSSPPSPPYPFTLIPSLIPSPLPLTSHPHLSPPHFFLPRSHAQVFQEQSIDLTSLMSFNDEDLKRVGIK